MRSVSAGVSVDQSSEVWSTTPIRSRKLRSERCGSKPSTSTSPPSRVRYPSRISTVVVLPAPLGPSSPKTSPSSISKLIPRSASSLPYRLRRSSTWIALTRRSQVDHEDARGRERRLGPPGERGCEPAAVGLGADDEHPLPPAG